jgi:hypothetical protein
MKSERECMNKFTRRQTERKTHLGNSNKILICHGWFIFFFLWRSVLYYVVETDEIIQDVLSSTSTPFYPHFSFLTAYNLCSSLEDCNLCSWYYVFQ